MVHTELTAKAMQIAFDAHLIRQDIKGVARIYPPHHLAEQMNNETRCCIALLYDVVENTYVVIEELEKDFPLNVIEALKLLIHDINIDCYKYIEKICKNRDASFVKMAELIHNITENGLLEADSGDKKKNRCLQSCIWALKMITDALSNEIIVPACEDDLQWKMIWKQYPRMNRMAALDIEINIEKCLDSWQIDILRGKPVNEQMTYFEIEIIKEKKGTVLTYYCNVETVGAEHFMEDHSNKMILLSNGCVVGILDINTKDGREYCKKVIEPIFVNAYKVCRYCKSWIDHSWDHYAAIHETISYRMKWKEK